MESPGTLPAESIQHFQIHGMQGDRLLLSYSGGTWSLIGNVDGRCYAAFDPKTGTVCPLYASEAGYWCTPEFSPNGDCLLKPDNYAEKVTLIELTV